MSRTLNALNSEVVALISVICIVGLFLVAFNDRETGVADMDAKKLAQRIQQALISAPAPAPAVSGMSREGTGDTAAPQAQAPAVPQVPAQGAAITGETLSNLGIAIAPPLYAKASDDSRLGGQWLIEVWNTEGVHKYLASPQGVEEAFR